MSDGYKESESPVVSLKNETARRRWELFHRAIAYAKQSNDAALSEADDASGEAKNPPALLTIIR